MIYRIAIKEKKFDVEVDHLPGGKVSVSVNGEPYDVVIENYDEIMGGMWPQPVAVQPAVSPAVIRKTPAARPQAAPVSQAAAPAARQSAPASDGAVVVPIPGRIMQVNVKVGDQVERGQVLAIMEAMKMENNILSHKGGRVKEVLVQKGSEVATGDVIMLID